jgi:5-methylcytosine-specific restriction enzyme subunit McrC
LFAKSLQVPRLDDQPALAEHAAALWELVARWFVRSTTTVLRRDLSRDYHGIDDVLHSVRGRVHGVPTARAYYAGRIELHCSFDDFAIDTPLNRLLRAAAREVSRSTLLTPDIRKDAARLLARFEDVGELREPDFSAAVDRRTWYYRDAVVLARHILRCVGRTFEAGAQSAWSFLIRTPELVEAGIRQILSDNLGGIAIRKLSAPILGATFGAHPDIVFGPGWAVGDVKYKLNDGSWNRPDLYEVVAFASAFRCQQAALLCFAKGPLVFDPVGVGEINVAQVAWNCSAEPARASEEFCETVRVWANRLANCQTLVAARANRPAEA